jgi:hypothetical protein
MSKNNNTTVLDFALWVFFAGISIGAGIVLYFVSGFGSFEFPLLVGCFNAYISVRKYKELCNQQAVLR